MIIGPEYYNLLHERNALLPELMKELETAIENICNDREYAAKLGHNAYQYYTEERPLSCMLEGFRKAIED